MTRVGQHGACGMPMMIVGRFTRTEWDEEDQREYERDYETWQCPCGCTKRDQLGRTSVEGNIG